MKFNINEIAEKAYKGFLFFVSVFIICLGVLGIPFIIKIFGWQLLYLPAILITFYFTGWLWEKIMLLIKERMK